MKKSWKIIKLFCDPLEFQTKMTNWIFRHSTKLHQCPYKKCCAVLSAKCSTQPLFKLLTYIPLKAKTELQRGGSMSQVVGLPNNSYKPITNTAWVRFVNYKKGCTRIAAASDKVYQLLAHGRWFSPGTPASSTTKTVNHDIAEILLKVALNTNNQIKSL